MGETGTMNLEFRGHRVWGYGLDSTALLRCSGGFTGSIIPDDEETVFETLENYSTMTWLAAQEDFTEF
jgi:hypothetical protein